MPIQTNKQCNPTLHVLPHIKWDFSEYSWWFLVCCSSADGNHQSSNFFGCPGQQHTTGWDRLRGLSTVVVWLLRILAIPVVVAMAFLGLGMLCIMSLAWLPVGLTIWLRSSRHDPHWKSKWPWFCFPFLELARSADSRRPHGVFSFPLLIIVVVLTTALQLVWFMVVGVLGLPLFLMRVINWKVLFIPLACVLLVFEEDD